MQMTTNFYLVNRPDKNDLCRINLHFNYNGTIFKFNTGVKVKKKHWNNKKQFVNIGDNDNSIKNDILRLINTKINEAYNYFRSKGIAPDNDILKTKLDELINKKVVKEKSFYDYFNDYLEIQKPPQKSVNTHKKFVTTLNHLQNFENHANYKISFYSLDDIFFSKFYNYFIEILDNGDNAFSKYIRSLNQFLKWSFEKNYYIAAKPIFFKVKEKSQTIFNLNADEFLLLYNTEIENKRLSNIRDLFCFGCVTGIRFAAIQRLTANHIQFINEYNHDFIVYLPDKTVNKKTISVPLSEYAKQIIEKHKGNEFLLPQISNQKANKYLKELAEFIELNRIITKVRHQGSKTKEIHYKLHEVISFHTSKKTCASLLFKLGVPAETIVLFTSNTLETIKRYIGIDKTDANNSYINAFNSLDKINQ